MLQLASWVHWPVLQSKMVRLPRACMMLAKSTDHMESGMPTGFWTSIGCPSKFPSSTSWLVQLKGVRASTFHTTRLVGNSGCNHWIFLKLSSHVFCIYDCLSTKIINHYKSCVPVSFGVSGLILTCRWVTWPNTFCRRTQQCYLVVLIFGLVKPNAWSFGRSSNCTNRPMQCSNTMLNIYTPQSLYASMVTKDEAWKNHQ